MKKKISVMMVEDHPEYRDVIGIALQKASGIELISEFGTAERALRSLQEMETRREPDVILLDLNLPGMSGLDAVPFFSKTIPNAKIIILSQSNQEADVLQAITLGAAGYLLKSSTVNNITNSIRIVMDGGAPIDAGVAKYLLATLKAPPRKEESLPALSDREMEILTLVAKGHLKKEIAEILGISVHTVVTHTGHIYQKLNVANAPSAIDKAHTLGLFRNKK